MCVVGVAFRCTLIGEFNKLLHCKAVLEFVWGTDSSKFTSEFSTK